MLRLLSKLGFWPRLALASALLRLLFSFWPQGAETLYSRGFFILLRLGFDYTLGQLPFPSVYLFFIGVFGLWIWQSKAYFQAWPQRQAKQRLQKLGLGLFNWLCILGSLFLWLWGYNYARLPIEKQLQLNVQPVDGPELLAQLRSIQDSCRSNRAAIPLADTNALPDQAFPENLEAEMRQHLLAVLQDLGYPSLGQVRGRVLPAGTLLSFGASGIYWPFSGEGHLDGALHIIQRPFTLAHEMAHGYGFGDEADCNFLAYLACLQAQNPALRYSGMLSYRRYLLNEVWNAYPDFIDSLRQTTPIGMMADQKAIYAALHQHRELFPQVQRATYDLYLKTQGVKDGILSYNRVVLLVSAWQKAQAAE